MGYRIIVDRTQLDHTGRPPVGIMEVTPSQLKQYLSKHPKERLGGTSLTTRMHLYPVLGYKLLHSNK